NRLNEGQLFWLGNEAKGESFRWESTPEHDLLYAQHRGYVRLNPPVTHKRQIYFDKGQGFWIVRDTLTGTGSHQLEWYFHFDTDIDVKETGDLTFHTRCEQGANLALKAINPAPDLSWAISDAWVSRRYGVKSPARTLHFFGSYNLPKALTFLLYPYRTFDPTAFHAIEKQAARGAIP
ncbi:MAG: heparinase II/III family protein, partial [Candidatus Methylomirabilales bacterium]